MNATKRPWTVAYYATQDGQGGSSHYTIKYGSETVVRSEGQVADDRDEANARLIVLAVNLHDELVEALENMVGCIEETGALATMYFDHARALLKRAKGE